MDDREMLYRLEENTRLESFFCDYSKSSGEIASYSFGGRIEIDITKDIAEDILRPSHDFLWNTDRTSLAYLGNNDFNLFKVEEKGPLGGDNGIGMVRFARHLNLIDLSFDFLGIIYVLCGKRKMIINGKDINLVAGNAVLFAPNSKYSILSIDQNDTSILLYIRKNMLTSHFSRVFSDGGALAKFLNGAVLLKCNADFLVVRAQPDKRLHCMAANMLVEQEKKRAYSDRILMCSAELFLYTLFSDYSNCIVTSSVITDNDQIIMQIFDFIRENHSDVSLKNLTQQFYLSSSYISRMLKQRFGKNYIQLLTEIRLNKAKELLSVHGLSIELISQLVGYKDARQFRRVFKEAFDISPYDYRSQHSK